MKEYLTIGRAAMTVAILLIYTVKCIVHPKILRPHLGRGLSTPRQSKDSATLSRVCRQPLLEFFLRSYSLIDSKLLTIFVAISEINKNFSVSV